MMTKTRIIKIIIRLVLLLFIAGSVGYLFAKEYGWGGWEAPPIEPVPVATVAKTEAPPLTPDRVVAYYFHGNYRCAACTRLEAFAREAMEKGFPAELKDGRLSFEAVNVEESWNRHFIRDYDLVAKSVVIALKSGGKDVRSKNLQEVWKYLGSREKFLAYVQAETKALLEEIKR